MISWIKPFLINEDDLDFQEFDDVVKRKDLLSRSFEQFFSDIELQKTIKFKKLYIKKNSINEVINFYGNVIIPPLKKHIKANGRGIKTLDRFKVIAGTEIAIIHTQPIQGKNQSSSYLKKINAKLAIYISLIMFNHYVVVRNHDNDKDQFKLFENEIEDMGIRIPRATLDEKFQNFQSDYGWKMFLRKHDLWLQKCSQSTLHVVASSHSWLLAYLFFCASQGLPSNMAAHDELKEVK